MSTRKNTAGRPGSVDLRYLLHRAEFSLDVDLQIPARGITGLFGESGSGKTTLLRCIAGLEEPTAGRLSIDGDVWQDTTQKISRAVHERRIGYVFQDPRLFRHLNVRRNLEYGRRRNREQHDAIRFEQIVDLLGLEPLLERTPQDLSGGEIQRVAIARALLRAPRLVLMDEPLAALDRARRDEILPFLDRLHAELSLPILYVSHSIDEVCRLCDHLVIVDRGRVLADGELQSVLVNLELPLLAGENARSVIEGSVDTYDPEDDLTRLNFSGGSVMIPGRVRDEAAGLRLLIRANDVSLCRSRPNDTTILNIIPVIVDQIHTGEGPYALVRLRAGDDLLTARITRRSCNALNLQENDEVLAQIKSVAVRYTPHPE